MCAPLTFPFKLARTTSESDLSYMADKKKKRQENFETATKTSIKVESQNYANIKTNSCDMIILRFRRATILLNTQLQSSQKRSCSYLKLSPPSLYREMDAMVSGRTMLSVQLLEWRDELDPDSPTSEDWQEQEHRLFLLVTYLLVNYYHHRYYYCCHYYYLFYSTTTTTTITTTITTTTTTTATTTTTTITSPVSY